MSSQDHQQGKNNNEYSVPREYSGCAYQHAQAAVLTMLRDEHAPG